MLRGKLSEKLKLLKMQEHKVKILQKSIGAKVCKNAPKFSVITPAYNISEFVAETLESVFAQTFQDFELILINDGSPDTEKFEKTIEPFLEQIVYLKVENIGAGAARNVAIEHSRGEFIAFLDGDDVWFPEYLSEQMEFIEKKSLDLCYCDALLFGDLAAGEKTYMETSPSDGEVSFESVLDLKCNFITSGTVARKKKVVEAGMFEWEKVRAHDFHLWLRMLKNGAKASYQRKVLLKYRVHLASLSGNSIQRVEREINVFERVEKKIELSESEKNIVQSQVERLKSELEIERGKAFLLQKDYISARKAFSKANEYRKSLRLTAIIRLIQFAPQILTKIYRFRRSDEIGFIPQNEA